MTAPATVQAAPRDRTRARPPIPRSARPALAASASAGVVAGLAVLVQATLLADALAAVFAGGSVPYATLAGVLAAVAVRALATWAAGAFGRRAATTVTADLRARLLAKAERLGPGWLAGRRAGELTTLVTRGVDALEPYVRDYLPQLVVATAVPVAVLVRLATADALSAVIVAVTLPLVPLFAALAGARARSSADRQWAALVRLGGHFLDAVAGLRTLATFGRASAHAATVRDLADAHRAATLRTLRTAFLSALVLELVATLSVALVAVPIALRLLGGGLDLRSALLVLLVVPEAYLPLRLAGQRFHAATEALAVSSSAAGILDTPDPPRATVPPPGRGLSIELADVTARHPGRPEPVLSHASLSVRPGEWVAVAGPSGVGKSTILALLLGFLAPEKGTVAASGPVAWLPQRPHLFTGTVADNIRLGRPGVREADIRAAAEAAGAAGFVAALPSGYDTPVGERGARLSTGQRQRVALARVLLRVRLDDPPVVLLDEPTAGLDLTTEAEVVGSLRAALAGRAVLVAAHRPALLRAADTVVRVRSGALSTVYLAERVPA
jgi:thiol reductant ABC exporter CydD subunit